MSSPILEIRDLSCEICGCGILRHINLSVAEGETVVLLGRSGSGKTTLLKAVNGLVPAASGEILFEGRSTKQWDLVKMRRRMGYVIQDAGLFPHWTVEANVGLVPRAWKNGTRHESPSVWGRCCWTRWGLGAGRVSHSLSGRLQLSRWDSGSAWASRAHWARIHHWGCCLTSPLARSTPSRVSNYSGNFWTCGTACGKTALFVTHDVREALTLATRIALLRAGTIELLATPAEFLAARTPEAQAFQAGLEAGLEAQVKQPSGGGDPGCFPCSICGWWG